MTDKTKKKWGEEFDEKFTMNSCDCEYVCAGNNVCAIKQFISEKIEEAKKDAVSEYHKKVLKEFNFVDDQTVYEGIAQKLMKDI